MSRRENAHAWLIEPLLDDPSLLCRPMFGCQAVYLHGMLVLVLADTEQPWNGVMVATAREHHAVLQERFPELIPHPVLPKWLYLSAELDQFERTAQRIVAAVAEGIPQIGVVPQSRGKRTKRAATTESRAMRSKITGSKRRR